MQAWSRFFAVHFHAPLQGDATYHVEESTTSAVASGSGPSGPDLEINGVDVEAVANGILMYVLFLMEAFEILTMFVLHSSSFCIACRSVIG
jgi:hypothetical protein